MSITAARFFSADPRTLRPKVEDGFFNGLKTGNDTFKTTGSDRLADLDEACVGYLARSTPPVRAVLDIGVSSGATTLALRARLCDAGMEASVIGTDLSIGGYLVPVLPGVRTLLDENGMPIQHDVAGVAIRPWRRRADYFTGMLGLRLALNAALGARARRRMRQGCPETKAVRLVSPRVALEPDVEIERNDIFEATPAYVRRFHFVRAANVLNSGYFSEARLRVGFANALSYLAGPGSWLLLARTVRGRHVATLFKVSPDGARLTVVDRFNGGSEVEWLALETPVPDWTA